MRKKARAIVIPPNTVLLAQASIVGEGFMGVNFIEDFGNIGNEGKRVKFPGVLGSMAPESIPPHRLGDPGYRFPSRGRGWYNEPYRHSLAARGIKNLIANPNLYRPEFHEGTKRGREFLDEKGLEMVDVLFIEDLVDEVNEHLKAGYYDVGRKSEFVSYFHDALMNEDWITDEVWGYDSDPNISRREIGEFYDVWRKDRSIVSVDEIYIVGSRVTGFYLPESDVDVFVRMKPNPKLFEIFGTREKINAILSLIWDTGVLFYKFDAEKSPEVGGLRLDIVNFSLGEPPCPAISVWRSGE